MSDPIEDPFGDRPAEEAAAIASGDETTDTVEVVETSSTDSSDGPDLPTEGDPGRETIPELQQAGFPDADSHIEMSVMQVSYTTRQTPDGGDRPVIHVLGRVPSNDGSDPELEHVEVHGMEPYFYVPEKTFERGEVDDQQIIGYDTGGFDGQDSYTSIRGEDVVRVYGQTPRDVGNIRDNYENWEADILFPNRFLIDNDIKSGIRVPERRRDNAEGTIVVPEDEVEATDVMAEPRVMMLDIEVDDRHGFPEPDDADEEILCLTSHDSYTDEYVAWLYEPPTGETVDDDALDDYEFIPEDDPSRDVSVQVRTFDSEEQMLLDFLSYLDSADVDVLCGWNFDDFDAEYLVNRMDELNDWDDDNDLSSDRLSRLNETWGGGWGAPDVKGRVVFDLLEAYKRTKFTEMESYRLDAIGEVELGVGKERFDGDIGDLWENDPKRLLEYNLKDVELCVELDEKEEIITFWNEVRTFVGCKLEDAPIPGDAVDMYVLHKTHGRFVLPTKGKHADEGEEFEGGAVFEPTTGIVPWVTVLDLKSLYPMSMCTINASPETKVSDPENYDGETYSSPLIEPEDPSREPFKVHFEKEQDGIMREMVDELLAEREEKKGLRNDHDPDSDEYAKFDRQQAAIKVIMNSLFGVSGWDRFRLYDPEMSAATTSVGREVIKFSEQVANELDYDVTYGDTDSIMLSLGNVDPDDVDDLEVDDKLREEHPDYSEEQLRKLQATLDKSFEIEDIINDRYDEFASERLNADSHRFQIEFEKLYRRFLQAGKKKRYAGHIIWKEGKHVDNIDITGFEYQRSDIAPITKRVQKEVIDMLVTGSEAEEVKEYVHGVIEDFYDGNIPLDDVGIPGGIGKPIDEYDTDTAQVRGAKYANLLLGTNLGQGSKPKRLYLQKVHPSFYREIEEERDLTPGGGSIGNRENRIYTEFKRDPDVICYEYPDQVPEEFEINWDKMLNKTLQGPISRVLTAVDITWEDVKSGQTQMGIADFM